MYFQLGALLLLGSLSVSSATESCVCTKNVAPVCGSDGRTYGNKCQLECAQTSNPQLIIERNGHCEDSRPALLRAARQAQVDCICTLEYRPVCGTDGSTYSNRCALNCASRSAPVDVAYQGPCRNKREIIQDASRCSCSRNFAPVCGSDGITYDNGCLLDCAIQNKPELHIKHVGSCVNELLSCSCSGIAIPVCGTDGITYENPCFLRCAKNTNMDLDILHGGACDNVRVFDSESCAGCTRKVRPICGTDGNTYRNPCMLNCARDEDESLHIDYAGPCDSRIRTVDPKSCAGCTRKVKPVCGTDGNTYRNPCILNCERENDENLHIDYEGVCDIDKTKILGLDTESY